MIMRFTKTMIAMLSVGLTGVAFAGAGSGSAAGSAAAGAGSAKAAGSGAAAGSGSAAPAGMQMPKPPQELTDMAKGMGGTWKCTGKLHMGPETIDVTANITGKLDLDKMWWHESLTQTKAKGTPYHFDAYMTYDAAAKKWMRVSVDNMGVVESTTSTDHTTWTGTANGMGQSMQVKTVATPSDKEIKLEGQVSMDGKNWMPSFEMDCKK
jgi:uncharacterized protein DUF1579